jgi:alkanesulfonate monooxygenase SsuD/methylene tetrahydromethanopterin reductase-like flavin-dependent oxidoreductase (luciferase family)
MGSDSSHGRLGFVLPAPQDPHLSALDLVDLAKLAEASGYDDVYTPEGMGYEAMSLLGAIAVATRRVRIGTAITGQPLRSPALTAMGAVTLDLLSEGRLVLGLGIGHRTIVESWHGIPFSPGRARLREYVELVKQIATGHEIAHEGEDYHCSGPGLLMRPYRPSLPVYLATLAFSSMELAGEIAEGLFASYTPLAYLEEGLQRARRAAEASGRDPDEFEACCFVHVQVTDSPAEAREVARARVAWRANLANYNKVFARAGFEVEAKALQQGWAEAARAHAEREPDEAGGDYHLASWGRAPRELAELVSDELLQESYVIGDASYCRARVDELSRRGITPLICPQGEHPDRAAAIKGHSDTVRALAPAGPRLEVGTGF